MKIKKKILRIVFLVEFALCGYLYIYGSSGLVEVRNLKLEAASFESKVLEIKEEIEQLKNEFNEWTADSFNIEKYARERLAMGYHEEEVFFI